MHCAACLYPSPTLLPQTAEGGSAALRVWATFVHKGYIGELDLERREPLEGAVKKDE